MDFLFGENSFEIDRTLREIVAGFDGLAEVYDGESVEVRQLPDILMGVSLFSSTRLVVLKYPSKNKSLWDALEQWLPRTSDDIHLVIIEGKVDKRTTTFKFLKQHSRMQEFELFSDKDRSRVEQWVAKEAADKSMTLDKKTVQHLVNRVGVDQWRLSKALDIISLLDKPTIAAIDDVIEPNLSENVFQLFELALEGKSEQLQNVLTTLQISEDPYKLFGLLSSQVVQLGAMSFAQEGDAPAKDFSIHPYVASKLERQAKRLGTARVVDIIHAFADADANMKCSRGEPWLLIETLLQRVAARA